MHRALFGVSRMLPCTSSFRKVLSLTLDRTVRRTNVEAKQTSATWGPAPGESARRGASLCPHGPENLVWPPLPAGVPWVQGAAGGASWAQCRNSELLWGRLTEAEAGSPRGSSRAGAPGFVPQRLPASDERLLPS